MAGRQVGARADGRAPRARGLGFAARVALVAAAAALTGSCSFVAVPQARRCRSNTECRRGFGLGSVCGAQGYCAAPQPIPRCSRAYPADLLTNPTQYSNYLIIGGIEFFSDPSDALGMQAAQLAVRQANEAGGLQGRPFGLVFCDYEAMSGMPPDMRTDADATDAVTRYLVDVIGARVIIGPTASSVSVVAYNTMRALQQADGENATVFISPSATSPALTALDVTTPTDDNPGFLWRTVPPDSLHSAVLADDVAMQGARNVAVVAEMGTYGEALAELLQTRLRGRGVTSQRFAFANNQLGDAITMAGGAAYDSVVFISSETGDYASFVNGAAATPTLLTSYRAKRIYFADAGYSQSVIDMAMGEARTLLGRIRGTRPAPASGTNFDAFAADFRSAFSTDPNNGAYTPQAYDAAWLAMYGMAWAHFNEGGMASGTISAMGIARGLRHVSSGPDLDVRPRTWTDALAAFRQRANFNARGASGGLDFSPTTEEVTAPIELWEIAMDGATTYRLNSVRVVETVSGL